MVLRIALKIIINLNDKLKLTLIFWKWWLIYPLFNSDFIEIIDFLQHQYAGSTSLSSWERYEASLNKLNNDRNEVKELITKINDQNENIKIQYETLTSRLKIVEQLKDMLEQQIGSSDVQDIIQRFSSETKQALAVSVTDT